MKIILAAGGSGGHIFPSVALCDKLEKKDKNEIYFISSKRKLDKNILKDSRYQCFYLSVNPMPRGFYPLKIVRFLYNFLRDIGHSIVLVKRLNPDIVIGFGGYSSGAIVSVARLFNIPVLIHEQNYEPGRANKILSRFADCIATSFEGSEKFFSGVKGEIFFAGNPLRPEMLEGSRHEALKKLDISGDIPTILIMGGSQGSSFLNRTATKAALLVSQKVNGRVQFVHLTGTKDIDEVRNFYKLNAIEARVYAFLDRIDYAYAATDIAVSRSGAAAVFELAYYGKAMILVPYPNPKNNQRTNAEYFKKKGAAVYKKENDLTAEALSKELLDIMNDDLRRKKLQDGALSLSRSNAAEILADKVMEIAKTKRKG